MLQSHLCFPDLHNLLESAHPNLIGYQHLMEQMVQKYNPSGYYVQHEQMLTGIEMIRKLLRSQSLIEGFTETLIIQILKRMEDMKRFIYSNLQFDSLPDDKLYQRYSCLELQMQNQLSLPPINSIDQYLDCAIKLQWGVADYYDKICIEFDKGAQNLDLALAYFQKIVLNMSGLQISSYKFPRYQNTYQLSHLQFEPFEMVEIISSYQSTLELADIQSIYSKCSYLYELMQKYERLMTYWAFTISNYKFRRYEQLYIDPIQFTKSFYPQMQFYYEKITCNNQCMTELSEELSPYLEQMKKQNKFSNIDFMINYDQSGLIADMDTSSTLVMFAQIYNKKEQFRKEYERYNEIYRIFKWNFQQFEIKIFSKNQKNTNVKQAFQSMPLKRPYKSQNVQQERSQDEYLKMQNQLQEILINQMKLISDMTRESILVPHFLKVKKVNYYNYHVQTIQEISHICYNYANEHLQN